MKLQEAAAPLEEQPAKVAEAMKLFLQGLGYVVRQKKFKQQPDSPEQQQQQQQQQQSNDVQDLLQLNSPSIEDAAVAADLSAAAAQSLALG